MRIRRLALAPVLAGMLSTAPSILALPLPQVTVVVEDAPTTTVVDVECPDGYTTFMTTNRDRVCYIPDEVAANSNLQATCPSRADLYIRRDDED
jgi:hypothetical protein